jgi:hypothetical protein
MFEDYFYFLYLTVFMPTNKLQIVCQKIISGGQTGVDRGALDACLDLSFNCGGWCPAGRLAEDGAIDKKYPLRETEENEYSARTIKNIEEADGTLIIAPENFSGGTLFTYEIAKKKGKPVLVITPNPADNSLKISAIIEWLVSHSIKILNVAGPRESQWPGAWSKSKQLISQLLKLIH